jgi:hypothetical protein
LGRIVLAGIAIIFQGLEVKFHRERSSGKTTRLAGLFEVVKVCLGCSVTVRGMGWQRDLS